MSFARGKRFDLDLWVPSLESPTSLQSRRLGHRSVTAVSSDCASPVLHWSNVKVPHCNMLPLGFVYSVPTVVSKSESA